MPFADPLVFAVLEILQLVAVVALPLGLLRRITVLRRCAAADELTGLPNRRGLFQAYAALARRGRRPAVLMLDLTRFKQVNDRYGHDAGDALLRHVAAQLVEVVAGRAGAVAGRLGGDEFALVLPDQSDQALLEAVQAVEYALTPPATVPDIATPLPVSAVIGAAQPTSAAPADRPFRAADIALYHARHHRQPYAIYTPGMVHPDAADRHGPRLRDRRCAALVAAFDKPFFRRLAAGQVSSDVAHNDDIAELHSLLQVLDPATREFGTDTAELVTRCLEHGALQLHSPLTHVRIEATTLGQYRDGGFLVLATIADTITLTSAQIHPRAFAGLGDRTAEQLLAVVADTACRLYDNYQALAASGGHR
jgi:diguanylate cyclase (GGDEF)-like protein